MNVVADFLSRNLNNILIFVGGGGFLALFTLPSSKKKAEAEANMAMQTMYGQAIKDANEQLIIMREEYNKRIDGLQKELSELRREIESQRLYRCIELDCPSRVII